MNYGIRRRWWAPPPDELSRSLAFGGMPASLAGFIRRVGVASQLWICVLAVVVFVDWYQRMMMTRTKYDVFATAMRRFAAGEDPSAA